MASNPARSAVPSQQHSMLESLPAPILTQIFSHVSGRDCAALALSCSAFNDILECEESIWAKCCQTEFILNADAIEASAASALRPSTSGKGPHSAAGETSDSDRNSGERGVSEQEVKGDQQMVARTKTRVVRELYKRHFKRGRKYPGSYGRALCVWSRLIRWTQEHIPRLARSILPGASESLLDSSEKTLGVTFPANLRALYILHNGQLTPYDALIGASEEVAATGLKCPLGAGTARSDASPTPQETYHTCFHGLLGSYAFYDRAVSTRLLPIQLAVIWTNNIRRLMLRARQHRASGRERGSSGRSSGGRGASSNEESAAEGRIGGGEPGLGGSSEAASTAGSEEDSWSHRVLFAASFMKVDRGFHFTKMVFLDCRDGKVYVGGRDALAGGPLLCCTPPLAGARTDSGLLLWLEEYTRRLDAGMYRVRVIQEDYPFKGICLFPELPPLCAEAITRRVRVRSSALFVPEALPIGPPQRAADEEEGEEESQSYFAYSIRMALLSAEEALARAPMVDQGSLPMESCQLQRRHWLIEEGGVQVADVRGEAVVGKFPLLRQGEEEFVYQSCSQMNAAEGSIEGEFSFVPGRIDAPEGPKFEVTVAKFPLKRPEFIY